MRFARRVAARPGGAVHFFTPLLARGQIPVRPRARGANGQYTASGAAINAALDSGLNDPRGIGLQCAPRPATPSAVGADRLGDAVSPSAAIGKRGHASGIDRAPPDARTTRWRIDM